jgi:hypothetical protein
MFISKETVKARKKMESFVYGLLDHPVQCRVDYVNVVLYQIFFPTRQAKKRRGHRKGYCLFLGN